MPTINPYLSFKDTCEAAFNFYKSVFGGEFTTVMRIGEVDCGMPAPAGSENLIMHISLPIGNGNILMGSDAPEGFGPPIQVGNNYSVAVSGDSMDEAKRIFDGLSAGGQVVMPFEKAFWGDHFGMIVDKFQTQWMVTFGDSQKQQ